MRFLILLLIVCSWLATLVVGILWALGVTLPFQPEPVTLLLGLFASGLSGVVRYFSIRLEGARDELEEEKFSTPVALAYGYVQNFLEPAITALLKEGGDPKLWVYIPESLAELEPQSRERILSRIRAKQYQKEFVNLSFEEGRSRDVLILTKSSGGNPIYFDFPNTLLTLTSLVDYKIESQGSSFSEKAKLELGRVYIEKFRDFLEKKCREKGISEWVGFTDAGLGFVEET